MFGKIMENPVRCKYEFQNMTICDGRLITLEDEAIKVFINTKGTKGIESEEFRELLRFIDSSEDRTYQNKLANELLEDLKKAQSNTEWRHEYMTWEVLKEDCREGDYGEARGAEKLGISVEELRKVGAYSRVTAGIAGL